MRPNRKLKSSSSNSNENDKDESVKWYTIPYSQSHFYIEAFCISLESDNMSNRNTRVGVMMAVVLAATATTAISTSFQRAEAAKCILGCDVWVISNDAFKTNRAPIATSGDNNVYVTWWSNKSGDWEVFFKASTDGGKTFGPKINLSNSKGVVSDNAEIAAGGRNVYVTWWERTNLTSQEPVLRISTDNGKTFGEKIMLSMK
jgi:hypothetical protein